MVLSFVKLVVALRVHTLNNVIFELSLQLKSIHQMFKLMLIITVHCVTVLLVGLSHSDLHFIPYLIFQFFTNAKALPFFALLFQLLNQCLQLFLLVLAQLCDWSVHWNHDACVIVCVLTFDFAVLRFWCCKPIRLDILDFIFLLVRLIIE